MKSIIIVLAKAPLKGEVKNRLGKNIGMGRSKWVYEQLLYHTSKVTKKTKIKTVLFKNKNHKKLESLFKHSITSFLQKGKDLGEKMENTFLWAFEKKYQKVILIGTDLWSLNEKIVINSFKILNDNDLVIGPSYDGGYYLIGMKKFNKNIFKNIPWSTNKVLEKTISKTKGKKISFLEIANDIDSFSDLKSSLSLFEKYQKKYVRKVNVLPK